jgi:hypothetical protein
LAQDQYRLSTHAIGHPTENGSCQKLAKGERSQDQAHLGRGGAEALCEKRKIRQNQREGEDIDKDDEKNRKERPRPEHGFSMIRPA